MWDFGVYGAVHMFGENSQYLADALHLMWVKKPKGGEVCCRLVCKGCDQDSVHKDNTYSKKSLLINLKLLVVVGLSKNYNLL